MRSCCNTTKTIWGQKTKTKNGLRSHFFSEIVTFVFCVSSCTGSRSVENDFMQEDNKDEERTLSADITLFWRHQMLRLLRHCLCTGSSSVRIPNSKCSCSKSAVPNDRRQRRQGMDLVDILASMLRLLYHCHCLRTGSSSVWIPEAEDEERTLSLFGVIVCFVFCAIIFVRDL